MTVAHNNASWTWRGAYGDLKTGTGDFSIGKYIRRDSLADAIHHGGTGTVVEHPTKSYLMENRNLDFFVKGGWKVTWDWDEGDFTEDEINDFINNYGLPSPWTMTKDFVNRKVVATCTDSNYYLSGWTSRPQSYILKCPRVKIESTVVDSTLFCVAIMNNEYANYTVETQSISPSSTITVDKEGTICYLIPFAEVASGSNTLNAYQTYKLTSASVDITNNTGGNVKVARIYK